MAITVETLAEAKWREGKAFIFLQANESFANLAVDQLLICVGDEPVVLSELSIKGDIKTVTWKAYAGTEYIGGTGTPINEMPSNSMADSESGAQIIFNPTITQAGQEFFSAPIELVAQVGVGNRAYLNENIISNPFTLRPSTCYMIELTNNSGANAKYNTSFDVWME